jgi:hypothetical protein
MPWIILIAGIALLAAACSQPTPPCEGAYPYTDGVCVPGTTTEEIQTAAEIAYAFYGTRLPMPTITVFEKGDCEADVPAPGGAVAIPQGKIMLPDGSCAYGTWYQGTNTIYMTKLDWKHTIAHELLHQYLFDHYGDSDHDHVRDEWNTLLPQAVALIDSMEKI